MLTGVLARLRKLSGIRELRVLTHLANADDVADPRTRQQIESFHAKVNGLGLEIGLANSAGVTAWPESHADWVRPSIMLYGASPLIGKTAAELNLEPVMTLDSALIAVHPRKRGDASAMAAAMSVEDMPIGVVAIGYGDGYPRHAPAGTPVLVNGERVPLVGRVSMDMIMVDCALSRRRVSAIRWCCGVRACRWMTWRRAGTVSYELFATSPGASRAW